MSITMTDEQTAAGAKLTVSGSVDLGTADRLSRRIVDLIGRGRRDTIVDLAHVTFMDSTGLSALITAHRAAETQGVGFTVARPTPEVADLLRITGLDQVITVQR